MEIFGATFSGRDQVVLLRSAVQLAAYARGVPARLTINLSERPPVEDWIERAILATDLVSAEWSKEERISWDPEAISASYPHIPLDPIAVVQFISRLPFEVAVMPSTVPWAGLDYPGPAISGSHALLGWAMAFKGAGHEHALVSRRWLEYGPWRVVRGPDDTTLVQFHDLAADTETAIAQARPGHQAMVAGYLRPKHFYEHDVQGIYTTEDRLLRVVVAGRDVTASEMTDACAARRDSRRDPQKPIANVAFIFLDREAAERHLHELWLRELECRIVEDGVECRLDESYSSASPPPAWVETLGGVEQVG